MSSARTRRKSTLRPKHKHTKEYLKHYYPFIPLFVSIAALILVLFGSFLPPTRQDVLGTTTNISASGLLDTTNTERAKIGIATLSLNSQLASAAQAKAEDMANRNYWSHETPDGKEPWAFISSAGYNYNKAGENLAFGFNNNNEVIEGWLNSASHRQNMLDKTYQEVGFGITQALNYQSNGPATIVVAMYANPNNPTLAATTPDRHEVAGKKQSVRRLALLTGNHWSVIIVAAISGAGIMYLVLTHGLALKRAIIRGERFIIRNPLLDSLVIATVAVGAALLKTVGSIH